MVQSEVSSSNPGKVFICGYNHLFFHVCAIISGFWVKLICDKDLGWDLYLFDVDLELFL
jgi:hypothetical protein